MPPTIFFLPFPLSFPQWSNKKERAFTFYPPGKEIVKQAGKRRAFLSRQPPTTIFHSPFSVLQPLHTFNQATVAVVVVESSSERGNAARNADHAITYKHPHEFKIEIFFLSFFKVDFPPSKRGKEGPDRGQECFSSELLSLKRISGNFIIELTTLLSRSTSPRGELNKERKRRKKKPN